MFFSRDDIPPEIKEAMDHQLMHQESDRHDIFSFIENLNEDKLITFQKILASISQYPDIVNYYMGISHGLLSSNHGVCLACSRKHDLDLEEMTLPKNDVKEDPVKDKPEKMDKLFEEYNLQIDPEGRIKCKGCGMRYSSLSDRMRRKPDECNGCIEKAKWG